ncbi:hypothetical protein M1P56_35225 (plasmid) [Streptomyces sp. HU2014]|uniref:hypothetical protein n=1 Tax=Streptomyces sp. HU2014 TaxID=2939414 RepID=UPI00200EE478|nr:hypothetical protein [Streptomyces sp. HU2014]UQI49765.1 hypothetical protein M1P56_35225 [Streptomyces sp. HU2014]
MSRQGDSEQGCETGRPAHTGTGGALLAPRTVRPVLPSETAGHTQVDFPPVENGVDYLVSVADHLSGEGPPRPRDIKYAVLHLQAAAEVLLKARLLREHWSLVFKDPGTATRNRFEQGDFESCTTDAALDRLRNIAGVRIDDKTAASLKSLAKSRNALQHYGLTAPARAVEARAAEVLDFLLAFAHDHLLPQLPDAEAAAIAPGLDAVGATVRGIQSFLTKRRNRLRGELKDCQDRTIECPTCGEWALVIGEPSADCRFCHSQWRSWHSVASRYLLEPPGEFHSAMWDCPDCGGSVCDEVRVAAAPDTPQSLCFVCASIFEGVVPCDICAQSMLQNDTGMCGDCLATRFAKF